MLRLLRFATVCTGIDNEKIGPTLHGFGVDTSYVSTVPTAVALVIALVMVQTMSEAANLAVYDVGARVLDADGGTAFEGTVARMLIDTLDAEDPYPPDWPLVSVMRVDLPFAVVAEGEYRIELQLGDDDTYPLRHRVLLRR